jgi:hypothetical protein
VVLLCLTSLDDRDFLSGRLNVLNHGQCELAARGRTGASGGLHEENVERHSLTTSLFFSKDDDDELITVSGGSENDARKIEGPANSWAANNGL